MAKSYGHRIDRENAPDETAETNILISKLKSTMKTTRMKVMKRKVERASSPRTTQMTWLPTFHQAPKQTIEDTGSWIGKESVNSKWMRKNKQRS